MDPANYAGLAHWIKHSKQVAPNQQIIVVLNYNKRVISNKKGEKVANTEFGTDTFNKNINSLVNLFVNKGLLLDGNTYTADGVHIDFEAFLRNDSVLLGSLKYLRTNALASNRYFSVSAPVNFTPNKTWDSDYINAIAAVVNQVNPMFYDQMGWGSPIDSPDAYRLLWKSEVKRYSDAIGQTGPFQERSQLVPLMPSYERRIVKENLIIYHDPYVENMNTAILGLKSAIAEGANVHGAGIFWWPTFIGHDPFLYPANYHLLDQDTWMKNWVNSI
ncbi:hypothetical protein [Brevibacillus sp. NRS-1366]|uniref:hypothetical protein n=1 Tax=Brevibacillus sp. NRS-1366 TaxID=3233899 RepID=UPI003D1BC454